MPLRPPNQNEIWFDYVKYGRVKHCHHPDKNGCKGKIISAHSVQKERILSQLEENVNKNKLIYSLNDYVDGNHQIVGLLPIGKSKASIFTGFCDYHDKMFSAIENCNFTSSNEQTFLFSYRALTHGLHQLWEQLTWYNSDSPLVKMFPVPYVTHFKKFFNREFAKFVRVKMHLDSCLLEKQFSACQHHIRVFDFLPLTCSSVLNPIYTYRNIFLNPTRAGTFLVLNIIPDHTKTHIIISHIKGDNAGEIFYNELKTLNEDEFTEAISSLLLYCTSNTFFSPKLWKKFTPDQKETLYDELNFATFEGEKIKEFHVSKINFFKINDVRQMQSSD